MELPRLEVTVGRPSAAAGGRGGTTERQWSDPAGRVVGRAGGAAGDFWILLDGLAGYRFRPGSAAVRAVRQPGASNERVVDTFERGILPFVLQASGVEVLHASAVVGVAGVVALCGESGAGKSTLAAGLARRGHRVWADDAVAFECEERGASTVCLPFRIRLQPETEKFLRRTSVPAMAATAPPPRPGRRARLSAIVILRTLETRRESGTGIVERPPEAAFTDLLPHAYCFDPEDEVARRRTVAAYLHLVGETPTYVARRGSDMAQLPALLDAIEPLLEEPPRPGRRTPSR